MFYPVFIEVDSDGSASGWFPDVPGCIFAGDTFEEALEDAASVIDAHFEILTEEDKKIPQPRSAVEYIQNDIDGEFKNGLWAMVFVNIIKFMGRSDRINITLPHMLIEKIDRVVNENKSYSNRSHFLAEAARKELQRIS